MYKTVRHGENSLQYTILPQNDDFRIDGKLSSAGSSCASTAGGGRKLKAKRPKRRSFFAYLGLIFVCTVIVGAVLIPFLVSAECLPNPTEWFLKTKAALTKGANGNALHRIGSAELRTDGIAGRSALDRNQHAQSQVNAANIGKTVHIINRNGVEKIILRVNKTQFSNAEVHNPDETTSTNGNLAKIELDAAHRITNSTARNTNQAAVMATESAFKSAEEPKPTLQATNQLDMADNFVTEVRFEPSATNPLAAIAPTIVVTTVRTQYDIINNNYNINDNNQNPANKVVQQNGLQASAIRPTTSFSTTSIYSPHAPSSVGIANVNQSNNSAPAIPTIMTRIMQSPLLKSAAKKPIIPPSIVRNNAAEISSPNKTQTDNRTPSFGVEVIANRSAGAAAVEMKDMKASRNDLAVENAKDDGRRDWIHWPYIDPSTYFQWTGYKEDSVLLPALLGFALIGMILIITVCLVARNKRAIVSSVRKRNRNDVEETGAEDNATLLTSANLSDED